MLVGRGHDAALTRPRVAEEDGADTQRGPFVLGECRAAFDDEIWPEAIHGHCLASAGADAAVQRIERSRAGDEHRSRIGKRDEIARPGGRFRHRTMKPAADAHQPASQPEYLFKPCGDLISAILGKQAAVTPHVHRHERRLRITGTRYGNAAVAVSGERESILRKRRRNGGHGGKRPLREESAVFIHDEKPAVPGEAEFINLHRRDITTAERFDRVDVQAVDAHQDGYEAACLLQAPSSLLITLVCGDDQPQEAGPDMLVTVARDVLFQTGDEIGN